jgi:hypothetical protein
LIAQGHPRSIFNRAVERGNLVIAEATARELGSLTLESARPSRQPALDGHRCFGAALTARVASRRSQGIANSNGSNGLLEERMKDEFREAFAPFAVDGSYELSGVSLCVVAS